MIRWQQATAIVASAGALLSGMGGTASATVTHYDNLFGCGPSDHDTIRIRVIYDSTPNTINGDMTWFYNPDSTTISYNWDVEIYMLRDSTEFSNHDVLITPSTPSASITQALGNVSGVQNYTTMADSYWEPDLYNSPTISL